MATVTEHEAEQIDKANETGRPPVVFVHGLWLPANSWESWATSFEEAGYTALTPGWPDDPVTVDERRRTPTPSPARRSIRSPTTSRGDQPAGGETGRHRALLWRAAHADDRRTRTRRGVGGH
jgi:hypothetical protein